MPHRHRHRSPAWSPFSGPLTKLSYTSASWTDDGLRFDKQHATLLAIGGKVADTEAPSDNADYCHDDVPGTRYLLESSPCSVPPAKVRRPISTRISATRA